MAYSAVAVANSIIKVAKNKGVNDLTPMKIQKLMYFAQFFYLKNFEDSVLIDDNFVRWRFGPVIPSLYYQLISYGSGAFRDYIRILTPKNKAIVYMMSDDDFISWEFLDQVFDKFGHLDVISLSALIHRKDSSWSTGAIDTVITIDDMKKSSL
ncbi:hypothetical protein BGI03_09035 [Snodgrassella alvi]|uniref:Panacea domain-containing protein n=1 Tax=Snodgrassella alvi TaxID=1196083 RepID=UPI000A059DC4|nr:type II toxin-antitoxin system antitoxin SocA domain-containing protein [Snodgrassella alvi]ORF05888.1 hypothetical protein BGH98_08250 [Snodgrassella alvi]ORF12209.1 hypothetical protein BGI01_07350 [Snodgrassella alvi]ORF16944.1 hypothetical protein BGI03_09035 [Snodgrassella alvi]ORF17850.1 hypothetical protein BGI04_09480 [Snodgrassella alvi]